MTAADGKWFFTNTVAEETKDHVSSKLNLFLYECVCYRESDGVDVDGEPNIRADGSSRHALLFISPTNC